jgi:hypothetical protein
MRAIATIAVLAGVLSCASQAPAQDAARAAKTCEGITLQGTWLMTFHRAGKPEICFLSVGKKGRVADTSSCFVEIEDVAPYTLGGLIGAEKNCMVVAGLQPTVGGDLFLLGRLSGDRTLITGTLRDPDERHFPVTLTKFEPL